MLRKGAAADAPAVAAMLARAFGDDPFVTWLVRRDHRRAEATARFFSTTYRTLALRWDEIWLAGDTDGAALWCPPGKWHLGVWDQLPNLPAYLSIVGLSRAPAIWRGTKSFADSHPRTPHWYLIHLGVDPPAQGRGLGAALLRPVLERCDAGGVPAYLETAKASNLPFYRRQGFEVSAEMPIAGGPTIWGMWREPRPPCATPRLPAREPGVP